MKKFAGFLMIAVLLLTTLPLAVAEKPIFNSKTATEITAEKNAEWLNKLDFTDRKEYENATRGIIEIVEPPDTLVIENAGGGRAWTLNPALFEGNAPDTANPSLWRNTQLNSYAGLFEVCDGIYQVRGYDMANVTFIRTDNGYVVFDMMMCVESMQAALELAEKHLGKIDVKAVLYSHSHIDHYGGVLGLISKDQAADANLTLEEQLASGKIPVLAPEGFLEHAVSENVFAGTAMARRAQYQYGVFLDIGETGRLAMGIGLGQSVGTSSLIAPTYEVCENETITIDGLEIQFQLTPGTEAPDEMNAYFPKYKALWMAENCTGTLHNLYTLRGAQVRDAKAWAHYILEADQLFADKTDVIFQSHNWPHWGDEIHDYMINTAAIYQFIHDETLHYINLGYTAAEISNMVELPEELAKVWYTRQYYGTLSHNIKAVYQRYIGWYDANPVNLNLMAPEESAKKLVEYLGDTEAVLEKAYVDFEKGEYQWVVQITKELIYADPANTAARELCADALEQIGYQAESGTWRNAYLSGAAELRNGNLSKYAISGLGLGGILIEMTPGMVFDYIAIFSDSKDSEKDSLSLYFNITDTKQQFVVNRKSGVVLYTEVTEKPEAVEASVTCTRLQLIAMLLNKQETKAVIEGNAEAITRLTQYLVQMTPTFNIVEP